MKHTGFLFKFDPRDYVAGASPLVIPDVNPTADWTQYQPKGEKQYVYATFDTFSCTTFSALNIIETWVSWHLKKGNFSQKQIETLNTLGFFSTNQFNCSDRFTAIMSGTMRNGNYFQNVIDSIRRDGLLPEALFPFGGNSWDEYHNPANITQEMKDKAKKILDIIDVSYEWVTDNATIPSDLKKCPVQGAIPYEAYHAIEIIAPGYQFDSYEPYVKPLPVVRYAMKIIVNIKKEMPTYKYFSPAEVAKHKCKPELWQALDIMREKASTSFVITSGLRTVQENINAGGKPNSSHLRALGVDIACSDNIKRTKILTGVYGSGIPCFVEVANKHIHIDLDPSIHALGSTIIIRDDD